MVEGSGATQRVIFIVSDHTAVTAEAFAHSLISQFDGVDTMYTRRPFIDTEEKVAAVVDEIDGVAASKTRPIVFSTFNDPALQSQLQDTDGLVIGLYNESLPQVAAELGLEPSKRVGSYHGIGDATRYQLRLDAVDFALMTDDGLGTDHYHRADLVLIGASRVGKTPSCLYISMQYGILAANYPLVREDHNELGLPKTLEPFHDRLYGLTIEPRQLHAIRRQRRPDSPYSDYEVCKSDVAWAERLFTSHGIPYLDTTSRSIEEIAATIMDERGLTRRID